MAVEKPIDRLAAQILDLYGVIPQPPIDVYDLAYKMGVKHIHTAHMIEDGRLEHRAGDTRVYLNDQINPNRARFTLAHELGHLLLADPNVPLTARRMKQHINDEERFCDAFAACLLLPPRWLEEQVAGHPPSLSLAKYLSDRSAMSLSATVVRCNEVLDWGRALFRWKKTSSGWRWMSAAGVPRSLHGSIRSTDEAREIVAMHHRAGYPVSTQLPLSIRGREVWVSSEVLGTPVGAVAMLDLASRN